MHSILINSHLHSGMSTWDHVWFQRQRDRTASSSPLIVPFGHTKVPWAPQLYSTSAPNFRTPFHWEGGGDIYIKSAIYVFLSALHLVSKYTQPPVLHMQVS